MRAGDNPFNVQKLRSIRYRLSGQTWDDLLERLATLHWRAAIVGPHGHGKTTLLKDLVPHLEARGFRVRSVMLHTGDRRLGGERKDHLFRDLGSRDILCVDGAEQLGRWSWLALRLRSRSAGGLLITSHRPGLLPTLVDCSTTPELLAGIVRDLLGGAGEGREEEMGQRPDLAERPDLERRLDSVERPDLVAQPDTKERPATDERPDTEERPDMVELPDPKEMWVRHGGNVRDALWEMYDVWGRR